MKKQFVKYTSWFLLVSSIFVACKKDDEPKDEVPTEENGAYSIDYGIFPTPNIPADNQLTIEGVKLGRMLFYDNLLSGNNSMSCASCHKQQNAFSDTNRFSAGIDGIQGGRQAMAVFNLLWNTSGFFWDGRTTLLRDQALIPIQDPIEMHQMLPELVSELQASSNYPDQFKKAFGTSSVSTELIGKALEQFMYSIVSNRSKYDEYLKGNVSLTAQEERGKFLFNTEYNPAFPDASGADCRHCHGGDNFENDRYLNNGLDEDTDFVDFGREIVTGLSEDRAKFKVTSLRNIELTPPYMHDGRFNTLEEVVEHYNQVKSSSTLDGSFGPQMPGGLQLSTEDKAALVAFLKTLTDYEMINDPRYSKP
jgi:cytochrome c peroxidase